MAPVAHTRPCGGNSGVETRFQPSKSTLGSIFKAQRPPIRGGWRSANRPSRSLLVLSLCGVHTPADGRRRRAIPQGNGPCHHNPLRTVMVVVAGGAVRRVRPEFPSPGSAQHIGAGSDMWHLHTPLAPPAGPVVYGSDMQHHHARGQAAVRCAELALGGVGAGGAAGYGRLSGMAGGDGGARSGLGCGKGAWCMLKRRENNTASEVRSMAYPI